MDRRRHAEFNADYEEKRYIPTPSERGAKLIKMKKGYERLKTLVERRNEVRERVKEMDFPQVRTAYVDIATESLRVAREFNLAEEFEDEAIASNYAEFALDLATSFTPGVSLGRDVFEAFTGSDLITGEELSPLSRTFAMMSVASLGLGGTFARCGKVLAKIMKTGKDFDTCVHEFKLAKKIPDHWAPMKPSKFDKRNPEKELGVMFAKPGSLDADSVRIMPGNPSSSFINSRTTYVRLQRGGAPCDKFGNRLPTAICDEAHIPFDEFVFPWES